MIVSNRLLARLFVVFATTFILTCPSGNTSLAGSSNSIPTVGEPASISEFAQDTQFAGCGGQPAAIVNSDYEQQVVELVNFERVSRGIPPLKSVQQITEAARYHSTDLGQDNYFEHDSYDRVGNNLVWVCSAWDRIASFYAGGRAENIAAGYASPSSVMSGWMASSGHRANILNSNYWEIGVGYFNDAGSYTHYWTQDFGKRSGVFPLIINNEAAITYNRTVSLYVYGVFSDMRFRNNNEPWSSWVPFSNSSTWQLPPISGEHTVHVEMRYSGITKSSSDTIFLFLPDQPELGNLPDQLSFRYNLNDHRFAPSTASIIPLNIGNGDTLAWSVTKQGSWFDVSPTSGSTPQLISVTPNVYTELDQTIYTGVLTVTVTSPSGVIGSPHVISLELNVINTLTFKSYLPLLASPSS